MTPRGDGRGPTGVDLKAGAVASLVSSSFSSLFVGVGSRHIGRDPKVDFMEVAMVPRRERGIDAVPTWRNVITGMGAHMGADILWALVFFWGILPRVPPRRRRATIVASTLPWAVATAAAEYYAFLPWVQPWLRMQVPFWTASGVHVSSALTYPLFPWLRRWFGADVDDADVALARRTAVAMAALVAPLAALTVASRAGRDPRWPGVDRSCYDATFLYRMCGHHRTGLRLSELAAERGSSEEMRALGRLMAAQHRAEIRLMEHWWRGWFGGHLPPLDPGDRLQMAGMPPPEEVDRLARLNGRDFDRAFVAVMVPHHEGGVRMADHAVREARDPRVKLLADSIRHSQVGQVERMVVHE